jgi:hypothetical protein
LLILAEVRQAIVEIVGPFFLADSLNDLLEEVIREILGFFEQFSRQVWVVAQGEGAELGNGVDLVLAPKVVNQFIEVDFAADLVAQKIFILVERDLHVFEDSMKEIDSQLADVILAELALKNGLDFFVCDLHSVDSPSLAVFFLLERMEKSDDGSDGFILGMLVFQ